ncbi:NUDIX hydrolase [Streptomyces europaeiscabiei]|uniref:NUDIX hydrolase n=1 Tax=Streptomyces europaeiscabiei TaxID=146819 RepID=A0ABU4NZI7_9ACTN|nr:NUDIX hydrolase [Streptomyces europaeiscabiei]MDX3544343.1 NUDIX hydrolase [Streptomyces europaeiscabiei]MDX3558816.1 NUDIX hydrolase [Streptomyces europaeiscabiei]MDX3707248.1 NUDIX hydrolase [Streptomyces europaeiscabiei]
MTTPQPDYSSLKPLAAVIEHAIQNTPIRLGTNDWGTALGSQLLADISVFMGKTLGPDAPILAEVQAERGRQDAKFGEQNHPDGTGLPIYQHSARRYRDAADRNAADGVLAWRDVLLEEVHEALAEKDPAALRAELVQVAAVATAWIAAIDRRTAPPAV